MMIYNNNENSLTDIVENIDSFLIFKEGKSTCVGFEDDKFDYLKSEINEIFSHSILMPAFGVSLHNETLNEIKANTWLQLNFAKEQTKNGLKFNALLFKLEETQGFNLIRLYNNKYEGRCLFLNLDETINLSQIIQ